MRDLGAYGAASPLTPPPEFLRGHCSAFAVLLGEGALIAKRMIEGDLDDWQYGFGEGFGGGLDEGAVQELVEADVDGDAELAMQEALGIDGSVGEFGGDFAHVVLAHAVLVTAGDAHNADDFVAFVAHG